MKRILLPIAAFTLLNACSPSFSMNNNITEAKQKLIIKNIEENMNVDFIYPNGPSLLYLTYQHNLFTRLEAREGANFNQFYWGCMIMDFFLKSRTEKVKFLLANGANVDQESITQATNDPEVLNLYNLAQNLDNSSDRLWFIDNQTNADQEFLRKRLLKKYGIKTESAYRTRVKKLLLKEDERIIMDNVCCDNNTIRIFKHIISQ